MLPLHHRSFYGALLALPSAARMAVLVQLLHPEAGEIGPEGDPQTARVAWTPKSTYNSGPFKKQSKSPKGHDLHTVGVRVSIISPTASAAWVPTS